MLNLSLKFKKKNKLKLEEAKLSKTKKNQVIIKVHSCGICGSDLKILKKGSKRVKENRIMGHEISGEILNSGSSRNFKKGQKIILGADIPNKEQKDFAFGHEINGGFQKFLKVDQKILNYAPHYLTKKNINHNTACLSEPLACCLNGLEKINFKPKKNILIFGAGSIGNMIAKLCILYGGKKVFLIDKNNFKILKSTKNKKIYKLNYKNYRRKVLSILKGENINYCFVACNAPDAQKEAISITSRNGSINFFSGLERKNFKDPIVDLNTNLIHYKQLKIVGSHGSEKRHVIKAAKMIVNKKILLNDLITHVYSLKKAKNAFKVMKTGKSIKIIIKP